jgi:hypothetical protein
VWSSKIVGTRCDGKSQREGGRLQQVLGGAAGVATFGRHARIKGSDFGCANARTDTEI